MMDKEQELKDFLELLDLCKKDPITKRIVYIQICAGLRIMDGLNKNDPKVIKMCEAILKFFPHELEN